MGSWFSLLHPTRPGSLTYRNRHELDASEGAAACGRMKMADAVASLYML